MAKFQLSKKITQVQCIVYGYVALILMGAFLLMLPFSSRSGEWTGFLDALFTATSASCVTGLVIADTFIKWSIFGQIIILLMIQIGGLGFMTLGVGMAIFLHRRIGLWTRGALQESVNIDQLGGIVRLTKNVLYGTLVIEGVGAILLTLRFMKDFSFGRALYFGIFHSISAFCNAGFDLMGVYGEYVSLMPYQRDIVVNLVIMALIVVGGIGFIVWMDFKENKFRFKKFRLHTKIVLVTTMILIVGGALSIYLIERDNVTMEGMAEGEKILASFFASISARTAGFNTIDLAAMESESMLVTIILMFIGGSPGSTAGGIKTTTFAVLMLFMFSALKQRNCNVFGRRIEDSTIKKVTVVIWLNLTLIFFAIMVMGTQQTEGLIESVFEVVSAMGTVGLSTGITRNLTVISKIVIILLMYAGRVGSLTFAFSLLGKKKPESVVYPVEKISVG